MSESEVRVTIAGYRDLSRVGSGGFSMVYRAHQVAFDRDVAVKVLTVELVDENAQRRFQRECRASGRLSNHPNIVTVLDSGFTDDGRPFITTEFMSHGSLADRIDEDGPYSLEDVLDIGVKMCSALAAVHSAGILHRDIKPQNILVSDYGEPALADFGISAITVGPDASIGTSSITPLHVAPEVLEGQPTSVASDVYSLGSTLYMLLAGRAPFQLTDDDALLPLMRRVVMDPVPDIDRPEVTAPTMDLLRYTLEKQPFARYPTAIALGEAIQGLQAHLGLPVTPLRKPGRSTSGGGADSTGGLGTTDPDAVISGDFPAATIAPGVVPPAPIADPVATPVATPVAEPVAPALTPALTDPNATIAPGAVGLPDGATGPASTGPSPTGPTTTGPAAGPPAEPVLVSGGGLQAPPPAGGMRYRPFLLVASIVLVLVIGGSIFAVASKSNSGGGDLAASPPTTKANGEQPVTTQAGGSSSDPVPSTMPVGVAAPTTAGSGSNLRFDVDGTALDESEATPGGTLKVGIDSDGNGWNPAVVRFYGGMPLVGQTIYEPLMIMTNSGPVPWLAPSVTPNDTFDEWTIDVPSGVKFHDGTDLTAAVVKENFDVRMQNELTRALLLPVQSVTVTGAQVVVKMSKPWPAFPVALTGQSGLVAASATLRDPDGLHPIGTGPFVFDSATAGASIKVTKNPAYRYPGEPKLDGIDFTIVLDNATRRQGLESGDYDLIQTTDPTAVTELLSTNPVFGAKEALVSSVLFNTADATMKDLRLRQALGRAVNNEELIKAVYGGNAYGANAFIPPDSPWAKADTNRVYFDLAGAKDLLAEYTADHPGDVKLTITVTQAGSQQAAARELQKQWKALGVDLEISTPDSALEQVVNGTYQIALWSFDTPTDPDDSYQWFHTDAQAGDFTYNLSRLADSNVDKSYDKGRQSAQLTERQAAYAAVDQGLVDLVPAVFYAYLPQALASSARIVGWKKDTQGGTVRGGTPWANQLGFKQ